MFVTELGHEVQRLVQEEYPDWESDPESLLALGQSLVELAEDTLGLSFLGPLEWIAELAPKASVYEVGVPLRRAG